MDKAASDMTKDELIQEVIQLRESHKGWKKAALYLADCHAATAYSIGTRKSTSKHEKSRHMSICKKAAEMIRAGGFFQWQHPCDEDRVAQRCEESVKEIEGA